MTDPSQRKHQRRSLADFARILDRIISVVERGFGIAKHPQRQ
jgi:hypothetical protein